MTKPCKLGHTERNKYGRCKICAYEVTQRWREAGPQAPCKYGHTEGRYKNGNCKECEHERIKRGRVVDPQKPCKYGHTEGYNRQGVCKACSKERLAQWRATAPQILCKQGHTEGRNQYGNCITCSKAYIRQWQKANPDKKAAIAKRYNSAHKPDPEKLRVWTKNGYERNREKILAKGRERYKTNPDVKEKNAANMRRWRAKNVEVARKRRDEWGKANPAKAAALGSKRRAQKLQATPAWADQKAIEAIYETAIRLTQETGVLHHVDHIIPLKGRNVRGLHVEYNLQVLTATENISKGNRL